jgi:hypothetical protein
MIQTRNGINIDTATGCIKTDIALKDYSMVAIPKLQAAQRFGILPLS